MKKLNISEYIGWYLVVADWSGGYIRGGDLWEGAGLEPVDDLPDLWRCLREIILSQFVYCFVSSYLLLSYLPELDILYLWAIWQNWQKIWSWLVILLIFFSENRALRNVSSKPVPSAEWCPPPTWGPPPPLKFPFQLLLNAELDAHLLLLDLLQLWRVLSQHLLHSRGSRALRSRSFDKKKRYDKVSNIVESDLPAKLWRFVGCTKIISW